MKKNTLLLIGNHLHTPKRNKNVWHFLAEMLASRGWGVMTTSDKLNQGLRLLDMIWTIIRYRKQYALAQVDVFSGKAFIWAEVCTGLLKKLRKPMILTLHGGKLPEFARQHPRRVKRVLQHADVVVSPSPYHQMRLKEYRGDIRLIPNPVNINLSRFIVRRQARPKLIWVRAFHEVYNPSLAIRVLQLLVSDFPECELLMIGPDKEDGSLVRVQEEMIAFNLSKQVRIVGGIPHTDVPDYLNQGDIFINTTNYDTAPRSVLEAMANGLCVVSTNVGGMPWIISDGEDGLLVPPNDARAMAAAVGRIFREPVLAEKLSKNARQTAEKYDWSFILPQWEALFTSFLQR
jgi:glycosyltransferase involved in cell wall biosynthesis